MGFENTLDLSGLDLTELPPGIEDLPHLEHLDLNNNHLTELPARIGLLTNLQSLNISNNRLERLTAGIRALTNLTRSELAENHLTELPAEIGDLNRLTYLNIEDNLLIELPNEIQNLRELIHLNVLSNPLRDLPKGLHLIEDLEIVLDKELLLEIAKNRNHVGFLFLPLGSAVSPEEMRSIINEGIRALPLNKVTSSYVSSVFGAVAELNPHQRNAVINDCLRHMGDLTDLSAIAGLIHSLGILSGTRLSFFD
ncbi:MAG: leucine-rich repeat domain-containing protein [Chlamydiae bacterium]|nr:leucine-rich repeat domain-containing protein [Chlamydiota bacterium]